jgi:putative cell wall-binding protein
MRTPRHLPSRARRRPFVALVTSVAIGIAVVIIAPGTSALATPPTPSPAPHSSAHTPLKMGTFHAGDYAAAAAKLPSGITAALQRDVHLSAAQYLANSAAAIRAPKVVSSLKSLGVRVLGSRMSGAKLTVNVASAADVRTVEAAGATAVIGAPKVPDFSRINFHSVTSTDAYGGQGYFYQEASQKGTDEGFRCSIGFNGYSVATGARQFVSAGHCVTTIPAANSADLLTDTPPTVSGGNPQIAAVLGKKVTGEAQFGSGRDYGIVSVSNTGIAAHNSEAAWGGNDGTSPSTGKATDGTPIAITGEISAMAGETLCKSGSTSGFTCGTIEAVDESIDVSGVPVNAIIATTCLLPGDSGGGAFIGSSAVGIDSGSNFPTSFSSTPNPNAGSDPSYPCGNPNSDPALGDNDPGFVSVFFPMVSASNVASVKADSVNGQQGAHWQLGVQVTSIPTVTSPASGATEYSYSSMSGTLTNATSSSTALLYLDGSVTPFRKVTAVSGSWTMPLTGIAVGTHSYVLAGGSGWSPGPSVFGTFTIAAADRIGGADRYQVAVNMAQQEFPSGGPIPVLYIADGLNYPDGLSAAPAAAHLGGTLLLTAPTAMASEVVAEVNTLQPTQIFVAGGTGSVSASVFNKLTTMAGAWGGTVTRDGGATRYQSSQSVAESSFPMGTHLDKIFIANGGNFPDALSESGAAAEQGSPVVLVPGTTRALDATTIALMQSYTPSEIVIAGGAASVSTAIQNQLTGLFPTVIRLGGADRYQVSNLINTTFFPTTANAYFANGGNFPDALGGGVLAASVHAPLTVTPSTCMEPYDITALVNWGTTHVTLLGGTASQSPAVAVFTPCK